jgi:hypothetical protein
MSVVMQPVKHRTTAAASPSSLPQSSTGLFDVNSVLRVRTCA